jgi:DNA polymerase-3 subunit alpha
MKFPGYFLIVSDFIKWAKAQDIPVGPGRGSGAGSLVAYALTITDLDPLRFGLLFERFLNPERVSMPDFDIDFCQDRRDEVIRLRPAALRPRARWRRSSPSARCRRAACCATSAACSRCPTARSTSSASSCRRTRRRRSRWQGHRGRAASSGWRHEEEPVVARLLDIALKLEGLNRHASTHAAGRRHRRPAAGELVPLYRRPEAPTCRSPSST